MASIFVMHSLGLVAENKRRDERKINVLPIEDASAVDGEITFNPTETIKEGIDSEGNAYRVKVITDNTINCEWLPASTNRLTPPDVVRGELVEIFRLGDTDQFYWRTMGLRDNLRTLETVIYAFSAEPTTSNSPLSLSRCYYFEVSTHEKKVTFSNSKANGEPFKYTFQFNTDSGMVILNDDIGNQIELVSKERIIKLTNADNSFIDINKKKITISADEQIQMVCKQSTYTMTPDSTTTVTKTDTVKTGGTSWVQEGSGMTATTPVFNVV